MHVASVAATHSIHSTVSKTSNGVAKSAAKKPDPSKEGSELTPTVPEGATFTKYL